MIFGPGAKALMASVAFAASLVGPMASSALARTNYAVVVGVTEYPHLPRNTWLVGPRNDALLVRDYLLNQSPVPFDPANVAILADDVDGGREPTLASIVETLDDMAQKAEPGDFLYLQFSGHGFQQTAADPSSELDGLDEIFLPKDTGRWVDRTQGMPNVLVDDMVGDALDRIREKGAFVWVVFDSCHSGTATRAAPGDDVQERKIDPESVGMPPEVLYEAATSRDVMAREAPVRIEPTGAASTRKGGMVAFFAAQTNETTPEMPLPKGAEGATKYGLFTHTIFSRLAENPSVTYRQLAEGVLQHYTSINRTSTTPLFEGDLDAPVFGMEMEEFIPQWPVRVADSGVTISGGLLNGLVPGTRLALLEKAGDTIDKAIGYLQVDRADNFTSRLVMASPPVQDEADEVDIALTEDELEATSLTVKTLGDIPAGAYARMVEATFEFTLTVARPVASDAHPERVAMVNELLEALAEDQNRPMRIALVAPGEPADLRLAVMAEASLDDAGLGASTLPTLWFLPESGELSLEEGRRPPSITMESDDTAAIGDAIAQYLARIYRATNLARIGQGSDYGPQDVEITFTLRRQGTGEEVPIETTNLPVGLPGDRVHLRATNNTGSAVDINVLYIGSDYSIGFMGKERLQPSATMDDEFIEFTEDSYGKELIVAVASEVVPLKATLDLSYLGQPGVRAMTRGPLPESIADLIGEMDSGMATRAGKSLSDRQNKQRGSVTIYPVQTAPRP
ncbi:caspase family protein [Aquibium carbonis]|uniref:Caspase family protein n=1 Tax=Aquibium carbonis TaxID=2495581 RepID=A0A3S0A0S4_9HYPH|nr:caspase family protein [Aquibium carbonis]RST86299.1 caspase family protein [Aquibium carbonis]